MTCEALTWSRRVQACQGQWVTHRLAGTQGYTPDRFWTAVSGVLTCCVMVGGGELTCCVMVGGIDLLCDGWWGGIDLLCDGWWGGIDLLCDGWWGG